MVVRLRRLPENIEENKKKVSLRSFFIMAVRGAERRTGRIVPNPLRPGRAATVQICGDHGRSMCQRIEIDVKTSRTTTKSSGPQKAGRRPQDRP